MKYIIPILIILLIPSVMATGYAEWYDRELINVNYTFFEPTHIDTIQINVWNETENRPVDAYLIVDTAQIFNGSILWATDNIGLIPVNYTGTLFELYFYNNPNTTRIDEILYLKESKSFLIFEYNTSNLIVFGILILLLSITAFVSALHRLQIMKMTSLLGIMILGIMMLISGWNFVISLFITLLPLIFLFETEE